MLPCTQALLKTTGADKDCSFKRTTLNFFYPKFITKSLLQFSCNVPRVIDPRGKLGGHESSLQITSRRRVIYKMHMTVVSALLVDQNKEIAANLVDQNNHQGIEFYSYAKSSFCQYGRWSREWELFEGPCSPRRHCALVLLFWNSSGILIGWFSDFPSAQNSMQHACAMSFKWTWAFKKQL